MIIYMIMDSTTDCWYNIDRSWNTKQENGSVWTKEPEANAMLRSIPTPNNAVKIRFVMVSMIEGMEHDDVAVVGGETWIFEADSNTWFCGSENNGCGVYLRHMPIGDDMWGGNVVIRGVVTILTPSSTRDEAMMVAITYWRKNHD